MNISKTKILQESGSRCSGASDAPDQSTAGTIATEQLSGTTDMSEVSSTTATGSTGLAGAATSEEQLLDQYLEFAEQLISKAREYEMQWQYAQAEETYHEALSILERRMGSEHLVTIRCGKRLALLHQISGNDKKAEVVYLNMVGRLGNAYPDAYADAVEMLDSLAEIYEDQQRYQDLEIVYRKLLAWKQQVLGNNSLEVANLLEGLAKVASELGSVSREEECLKAALPIFRSALSPGNERTISCLKRLMSAQERLRKHKEHSSHNIEWQG